MYTCIYIYLIYIYIYKQIKQIKQSTEMFNSIKHLFFIPIIDLEKISAQLETLINTKRVQ